MPRVAFLLPDFRMGGAERVALSLIESFLERGIETDLVLMRAEGELLASLPAEVRVKSLEAGKIRRAILPFARYLRERRPNAVQVSMWPLTVAGIIAHRLARSGARMVISDHNALSRQYGDSAKAMAALRATARLFYPLADARVVVSAGAADDLASLSHIPRDRFTVIYNPISPPSGPIETTPDVERIWSGTEPRILNTGILKQQKNQALLIRAFAQLVKKCPAKLMILGEGELRGELEELVTSLGVVDCVLMPGFADNPWPYYASADLFVLSSDYEGFGNVIVEALYAGLPVVSTDCPAGPSEILDGGQYGTLVPCGDASALAHAMEQALRSPRAPEPLRQRAEELSGRHVVDAYLSLLLPGSQDE